MNPILIPVLAMAALFICLFMAFRSLLKRGVNNGRQDLRELPAVDGDYIRVADLTPRCFCGEDATEPMPLLKRGRGTFDFLRRLYAAPPRYVRSIDSRRQPELCRIHAHVADAKMDEFIFMRVRGIFAEANSKVATEAASFERESLLKYLNDSLTDREKKVLRTNTNNVVPLKAANGDARDSTS